MSKRDKILEKIDSVNAFPASSCRMLTLLQNPELNLTEIAEIAEYDPGITANILKLANSAEYSSGRDITQIKDAMVRIGIKQLIRIMLTSSMAHSMKIPLKGYDLPPGELWTSAVLTGICADVIAEKTGIILPSFTFTAAILHDAGKILLASFIHVDTAEIFETARTKHIPFDEAERLVLGIDHAEAGAILLEKWKLPQELITPVRWHHQPNASPERNDLVNVLHIADALIMLNGNGIGREGLFYKLDCGLVEKIGLDINITEKIICECRCRFDDLKDIFSV